MLRGAIWAGVIGLAFLALASLPSPTCEPPIANPKGNETTANPQKDCPTIFGATLVYIGHFIHEYRDEITASSTAIVALFTIVLGVFTIKLSTSTRIAATAAQDSANTAQRALTNLERPWLYVDKVESAGVTVRREDGKRELHVTAKNCGRGVAELTRFSGGGKVAGSKIDVGKIEIGSVPLDDLLGSNLVPNQTMIFTIPLTEMEAKNGHEKILDGRLEFVFRGLVGYRSPIGDGHELGFCVRYDSETKNFVGHGGKKYNYSK